MYLCIQDICECRSLYTHAHIGLCMNVNMHARNGNKHHTPPTIELSNAFSRCTCARIVNLVSAMIPSRRATKSSPSMFTSTITTSDETWGTTTVHKPIYRGDFNDEDSTEIWSEWSSGGTTFAVALATETTETTQARGHLYSERKSLQTRPQSPKGSADSPHISLRNSPRTRAKDP